MKQIGEIGNYYGGLHVNEVEGKYFWAIENCDGFEESSWQEIPKPLYDELIKFENEGMPKVEAETPNECDKCRKNDASDDHYCPLDHIRTGHKNNLCNCCEDCQQECRDSI